MRVIICGESMLDFRQFRILTFDCYGTLINWEAGILGALRPILAAHGKSLGDAEILELYGELEPEFQRGEFQSYRGVLKNVVKGFGKRLGFVPSEAEVESLPNSLSNWPPFADTAPSLRRLKSRFNLAVISNTDDDLFAATARRLEVPFDHVITAQQASCYKPGKAIFELALRKIGLPREQILHCAQSVYHDVVPAKALGLSSVWVNRPSVRPGVGAVKAAVAEPDLVVPDLQTLANLAEG